MLSMRAQQNSGKWLPLILLAGLAGFLGFAVVLPLETLLKIAIAVIAVVLGVLSINNIRICMLLFFLAPYLPPVIKKINISGLNNLTLTAGMFIVSITLSRIQGRSQKFLWPKKTIKPVILILALMFLATLRTEAFGPKQAMVSLFFPEVLGISLIYVAYNYAIVGKPKNLAYCLYSAFSLALISFIIERSQGGWFNKDTSGYLGGGANTVGESFVIALPFLFFLSSFLKRGKRIIALGIICALVGAIIISQTRASWIGLIVLVTAAGIFHQRIGITIKIAIFIVGFVALWGPAEEIISNVSLSTKTITGTEADTLSSGRIQIWTTVVEHLSDPSIFLIGNGASNFQLDYLGFATHNHIMRFWVDMGLVGVIALMFLYASLMRTVYVARKWTNPSVRDLGQSLMLSSFAAASCGLFSHYSFSSTPMAIIWIQFGLLLGIMRAAPNDVATSHQNIINPNNQLKLQGK